MEINGIAHIEITVSQFEECVAFYRRLLPFIGLARVVHDTDNYFYCIGGRTGFGIVRCAEQYRGEHVDQARPGLHHVCFRARSREDVDAAYRLVLELGAKIVRAPEVGGWAPGYYSILFEDPAGARLEINYIPGKGLLADQVGSDDARARE
jgi:catechol 2,3-dioxygenase-like lactoylglutathione lyase family enzyme